MYAYIVLLYSCFLRRESNIFDLFFVCFYVKKFIFNDDSNMDILLLLMHLFKFH